MFLSTLFEFRREKKGKKGRFTKSFITITRGIMSARDRAVCFDRLLSKQTARSRADIIPRTMVLKDLVNLPFFPFFFLLNSNMYSKTHIYHLIIRAGGMCVLHSDGLNFLRERPRVNRSKFLTGTFLKKLLQHWMLEPFDHSFKTKQPYTLYFYKR